jgi:hypothetical protein
LSVFDEWKKNSKAIVQLKNKTPIWNDGMFEFISHLIKKVHQMKKILNNKKNI